MSRLKF
jgi:hypothetical protein